jgi:methylglutaconyl-CoA hydratase
VSGLAAPLLHFRVGGSTAARLLLTARTIDAVEAQRLGVFHEVVPTDLVWARAQEVAVDIARCAPQALRLTKQLINQTIGEQLETLMTAGAATSATARTTDDAREGLAAFREKREPRWP